MGSCVKTLFHSTSYPEYLILNIGISLRQIFKMFGSKELIVQEYDSEERSCVFMNYQKMDELLLNYGEVVMLKGRKGKEAACIVLPDDAVSKRAIGINWVIRNILQVRVGDVVTISNGANTKCEKKIRLSPTNNSVEIRYDVFRGIP